MIVWILWLLGNHHTIRGNNSASIFYIGEYATVWLDGVTMVDGYSPNNSGAYQFIHNLHKTFQKIKNALNGNNIQHILHYQNPRLFLLHYL